MVLLLALGACSGSTEGNDIPGGDTLTRAQRDSVIGASKLPGAGSVQRALDVADSAAARNERLDSLMY